MARETHAAIVCHCVGFTCHACKESTLLTVLVMQKIDSLIVERAFWAIGAAEIAPRTWMCGRCVIDNPRTCAAAEAVRARILKPCVEGVATEERLAWRRR